MPKRKYTLRRRAERQDQTRERIVDAAIALHEEIGPAATTISALAERAGVQRLTVYRHFPSETDVLAACSTKWFSQHPPPDVGTIDGTDPRERTQAIFLALYRYYDETQGMWGSIYPDAGKVAGLDGPLKAFDSYLSTVTDEMLRCWAARGHRLLKATLDHAVQFSTWQSLSRLGLKTPTMAKLAATWAIAVVDG